MSYPQDAALADTIIPTIPSLNQPSFESGSLKPLEDMSMAHLRVQPNSESDIPIFTGQSESRMFLQADSSDWPTGELEVEPPSSLTRTSAILTTSTRTNIREGPFAVDGDGHCDSPPELGTGHVPVPLTATVAIYRTFESYHHNHDGAAAALRKSNAQFQVGRLTRQNVARTRKDQEVLDKGLLISSPSPSPAPTFKRVMICREKTGTDWQSVFDVVKYDEEKRAAAAIKEMEARTGDMVQLSS
ncbi:hypothetical protein P692DRAFT_20879063 [Suillus brevipes Sb2]|nr:hypothetical protein P692DRAFT_20879063 [Suillus brevipes Sb2]